MTEEVRAGTMMMTISDAYRYLISCEAIMADLDGQGEGKESVIDSTRGLQHVLEERLSNCLKGCSSLTSE